MVNKYIQISIPYAILIKSSLKIENLTYLKKDCALIEPPVVNVKDICNPPVIISLQVFKRLPVHLIYPPYLYDLIFCREWQDREHGPCVLS